MEIKKKDAERKLVIIQTDHMSEELAKVFAQAPIDYFFVFLPLDIKILSKQQLQELLERVLNKS